MLIIQIAVWVAIAFVALVAFLWLIGFRVIRNDRIAIVEKWWSPKGSLKDAIIAIHGEAGYQPDVLAGRHPLPDAADVPPARHAARDDHAGQDRLRLRA